MQQLRSPPLIFHENQRIPRESVPGPLNCGWDSRCLQLNFCGNGTTTTQTSPRVLTAKILHKARRQRRMGYG
jgi:hypothetical protein